MSRPFISSLKTRFYVTVAASAERCRAPVQAIGKVVEATKSDTAAAATTKVKEEIFWMRDPMTGNWIPENRFGEVDAADLRAHLLHSKN